MKKWQQIIIVDLHMVEHNMGMLIYKNFKLKYVKIIKVKFSIWSYALSLNENVIFNVMGRHYNGVCNL